MANKSRVNIAYEYNPQACPGFNKQEQFVSSQRQDYQTSYQQEISNGTQNFQSLPPEQQHAAQVSYVSNDFISNRILSSLSPIQTVETETATVFGQTGIILNKEEINNFRGKIPISNYLLNEDENPEVICKKTNQVINFKQEIAVRYLRPPTPPIPGEIIIKEEEHVCIPPAPPLVIRQQPPRPASPPPLVYREAPPQPPAAIGQKIITISGKTIPPPPRKVIIERLAPLPTPPQSIIVERWLPYNELCKRKVIFQRAKTSEVYLKPRNTIIQWEAPTVCVTKEIKDLGVIRANPCEYFEKYRSSLLTCNQLPDFIQDIRPPNGIELACHQKIKYLVPILDGDIDALSLIDLDREGLSEYKNVVSSGRGLSIREELRFA